MIRVFSLCARFGIFFSKISSGMPFQLVQPEKKNALNTRELSQASHDVCAHTIAHFLITSIIGGTVTRRY